VHRRALGILFAVLAGSLLAIAVFAALEGGRAWVLAAAAGALGLWMGDLARRALTRR
jgi:NADPH-dependent curcumin reductase CurA